MALNIINSIKHETTTNTKVNKKDIVKAKDGFTKPITSPNKPTANKKDPLNKIKPYLKSIVKKELNGQEYINKYSDNISESIIEKLDMSNKLSSLTVLKGPLSMVDKVNNLFKSECDKDGQALLDVVSDPLNIMVSNAAGKNSGCDPTPSVINDAIKFVDKLPTRSAKYFVRSFLTSKTMVSKISAIGNASNDKIGTTVSQLNDSVKIINTTMTIGATKGIKTLTTLTANNILSYLNIDKLKDNKIHKDNMSGIRKLVDKVNKSKPKPNIDVKPEIDDKTIITYT